MGVCLGEGLGPGGGRGGLGLGGGLCWGGCRIPMKKPEGSYLCRILYQAFRLYPFLPILFGLLGRLAICTGVRFRVAGIFITFGCQVYRPAVPTAQFRSFQWLEDIVRFATVDVSPKLQAETSSRPATPNSLKQYKKSYGVRWFVVCSVSVRVCVCVWLCVVVCVRVFVPPSPSLSISIDSR